MVGTKRFKFDVFSNDVTLANEMESTGVAGRVHISEITANFLKNQYILEDSLEHKGNYLKFLIKISIFRHKDLFYRGTFKRI